MVPEWASFFTPERFALFIGRVQAALESRGGPYELDSRTGVWRLEPGGRPFSLVSMAQVCNLEPEEEWESSIAQFLEMAANHVPSEIPTDLETLRPMLKVRLYNPEALGDAPTVKVPLAEGLVICLAVDLPDTVLTLPRDQARTLGMSSEELFDLGLANVQSTVQAERSDRELRNGGKIVSLAGDDFFTTSLALALDAYAAPEPPHGYLVAVPNRHEVLAVPLESERSLGVLPALLTVARDTFRRGPGSLSPYLYWVRRRRWARIELEESPDGVGIAGPDPFIEEVVKPLLGA
ncbi:MAG: hypothetical protein ACO1SV_17325 [Fimbriimonas sp.]